MCIKKLGHLKDNGFSPKWWASSYLLGEGYSCFVSPPLDKPCQKMINILPSNVGDTPIVYSPSVRFYITIPQIRTKDEIFAFPIRMPESSNSSSQNKKANLISLIIKTNNLYLCIYNCHTFIRSFSLKAIYVIGFVSTIVTLL